MPRARRPELSDDELFTPSLAGAQRVAPAKGERPWRLGSQFYVAFLGGVVAVTAIAFLNARRLGLAQRQTWLIAGIGLAALAAMLTALAVLDIDLGGRYRLAGQITGVLAFGAFYAIQQQADRVYYHFAPDDEEYDPMWVPGLIAVVLGLTIQLGAMAVVLGSP